MRRRCLIAVLLAALIVIWTSVASGQPDPERRTNLEVGVEGPIRGNGPLGGDAFLLLNRPHFPAEDLYLRVVIAPGYRVALTERATLGLGYGYGFDAPRGDHFGGQEAHAVLELKL